jgi:decaprenylphospho-beta-D-erythro-pentofuranosid-2-ulose 2-reductase
MTQRLLLVGATSAIAHAVARRYAAHGARLYLLARRAEVLTANAADLRVRGAAQVETAVLDANEVARHAEVLDEAFAAYGGFDAALVAHGVLPDQAACEQSVAQALASFDTNARSVVALLTDLANRFERQGAGVMAAISSPAGDRGRASNYAYGAAKAAVTTFCAGLRHRLYTKNVRVITIEPGFVDTPMTAGLAKAGPLWASADRVAADIERALERGWGTVYTPWFWRWIMLLIRHVPERIFVRTRL